MFYGTLTEYVFVLIAMTFHACAWCKNTQNAFKNWDFHFTEGKSKAQEWEWIYSGHKADLETTRCGLADPHGFVPWFTLAVLCTLVHSTEGSSRNNPGQAKWPSRCSTLSPLSLEKFFLNHQPSCSFSGIGFLSAEHPMCWRMSEHGLPLCRWQILRLTSVGGCRVRCTQPTHCQKVVLAFAHAPGYFTECHHLVMKRSPVTTAHEHRNSLCP